MTKVNVKNDDPLIPRYGARADLVWPAMGTSDETVCLNIGWLEIRYCWLDEGVKFILATTPEDYFSLANSSVVSSTLVIDDLDCDWVYAIDYLPDNFFDEYLRHSILKHDGFSFEHGSDSLGREFLILTMPDTKFRLLFRDPQSSDTDAWNSPVALPINEFFEITQVVGIYDLIVTDNARQKASDDQLMIDLANWETAPTSV